MNRKERRAAQNSAGGAAAQNAQTLFAQAIRHHQAGQLEQAIACYRQAVQLDPRNSHGFNNLGSALWALRRADEAAQAFAQAARLAPDEAPIHHNLGNALAAQGKLADAERAFERAYSIVSEHPAATAPDYAAVFLELGNVHRNQGRADEAARLYQRALAVKSDFAPAYNNLGALLLAQGRPREAAERFAHALLLTPELFDQFAEVVATLLRVNPTLKSAVDRVASAWPDLPAEADWLDAEGWAAVASDPLLRVVLQSATVRDIGLERALTAIRKALLERAKESAEDLHLLEFASALAQQCFMNEYVWALSPAEQAEVERLRAEVCEALVGERSVPPIRLAILACYGSLGELVEAPLILQRSWPQPVVSLLTQQVREPLEERADRERIPRLTEIADGVSALVREQYEQNPYPRWSVAPPRREATNVEADLRRRFPGVAFRGPGEREAIDILVAGCGTGQHPIWLAQRYPGARVLAVDLSLSSLSYARRKTRELGLQNIEYGQADITRIGTIGRSFDVIDASGVLHHLADPEAGWRALLSLLRPDGLMRIGLYSKLGRREVAAARQLVAERGYRAEADDIRRCRQELARTPHASLRRFNDFYSVSECRDLLFHVQEHHCSIDEIESFLAAQRLIFIGFEVMPAVVAAYRQRFSDSPIADLGRWKIFESERPDTFAGMYQFWVGRS